MTEDDEFFAWLDGQLGPADAARMLEKVAADPELCRLAEQHRALHAQLREAFDPIAAAPVPERLQAAVRLRRKVVDFGASGRARSMPSLPQWAAIAATLAVGVLVGTLVPQRTDAPVEVQDGKLYAAAALDRALDTNLASAPTGDVRIGLTFRDRAGKICRSFTDAASSGLACRTDGRWQLRGLFAAPEGQGSEYRMAAGMDPNLAGLVDATISGEPFDAAQEKSVMKKGWRL